MLISATLLFILQDPQPSQTVPVDTRAHLVRLATTWLEDQGLTLGRQTRGDGEVWIGLGDGTVMFGPESGEFAEGRWFAYQEASIEAKMEYVRFLGVRQFTEWESGSQRNPASGAVAGQVPVVDIDQLIADKAKQLELAELDAKLREAGVSEIDIQQAESPLALRQLYQRTVQERFVQQAVQDLQGLQVIKTIEGSPGDRSAYGVCVLVLFRPENRSLADAFGGGWAPGAAAQEPGRELAEYLPEDEPGMIPEFGLRLVRGPDGGRCLIAYGQAGVLLDGTEDAEERGFATADSRDLARNRAQAELAAFVSAVGELRSSDSAGAQSGRSRVLFPKGRETFVTDRLLRREMERSYKVHAQAELEGVVVLREWGPVPHPAGGHPVMGIALAWSADAFLPLRAAGDGKEPGRAGGKTVISSKDVPIDW
ncbi:MAG: hypothetical protein H8E31_01945 [Planctomycetes bacterium]|nr:hypothetical protein [Planctomycetota bacterium]